VLKQDQGHGGYGETPAVRDVESGEVADAGARHGQRNVIEPLEGRAVRGESGTGYGDGRTLNDGGETRRTARLAGSRHSSGQMAPTRDQGTWQSQT